MKHKCTHKKTNLDRLREMSLDEAANLIYCKLDEICNQKCKEVGGCPFGDDVTPDDCLNCVKRWLESEVEEDG